MKVGFSHKHKKTSIFSFFVFFFLCLCLFGLWRAVLVMKVKVMMRKKLVDDDDDVSDKGIRGGGSVEGVMMMVMELGQREG